MTADSPTITGQDRHPANTAASILCYVVGVGWSVGSIPVIVYLIRQRALPMIGPIRAMSGPFEAFGIDAMILLALLFLGLNLLHILSGYWLWKSRRTGGILEIVLLTLSTAFWYGFALPIPPVLGLLQTGLLAAGWKSLRGEIS